MNLDELRDTLSWQQAIELSPQLVRLAEELPASEQMGLSWQLRQSMVELPAAIAADLQARGTARQEAAFRLIAALDLIEKVYPALDTAGLRADAERLVERLTSDRFAERATPAASPSPVPTAEPAERVAPAASGGMSSPAPVIALPTSLAAEDAGSTAPTSVQVTNDNGNHV